MQSRPKVGIAGVGMMGFGIALNVQKAGFPLSILDHPGNQDTRELVASGAGLCSTAKALAEGCDIIILVVTGSPQVEDVLTREDGILEGLKPGAVVIDCSTSMPASTLRMAARVETAGGRFLDAPMTRTPKEALEGRLNLLVGGERALYEEVLPLLESFAENITHVGATGAGHAMKLVHNFVSLGEISVIAEAAASAAAAGVDPAMFVEVLSKGGGGGVALDRLTPMILDNDPTSLKFVIANARKDIGYYTEMAGDFGTSRMAADGILAMLETQVQAGHGDSFVPELVKLLKSGGE